MHNDGMNPLLIILIVCGFLTSGQAFGVDFVCPNEFHNGPNIVTCRINTTAIQAANCLSISQSVTFDRTVNFQPTVVCMYKYDPTQPCIPETQHTAGKCWCSQALGEVIAYNFSYVANSILDEGGQLECKLCMLPDNHLDVQVSKGCRYMRFASLQESQTTNSSKLDVGKEQTDSVPLTVGITVGVIITILILTAVVIFFKKCRPHCSVLKKKRDPSNNSADHDQELKQERKSPTKHEHYDVQKINGSPGHQKNGSVPLLHKGDVIDDNL